MTDRRVPPEGIDDEDVRDPPGIVRRLKKTLMVQQSVTARLNHMIQSAPDPGPPEGPGLCDQIIVAANESVTAATTLKNKFLGR